MFYSNRRDIMRKITHCKSNPVCAYITKTHVKTIKNIQHIISCRLKILQCKNILEAITTWYLAGVSRGQMGKVWVMLVVEKCSTWVLRGHHYDSLLHITASNELSVKISMPSNNAQAFWQEQRRQLWQINLPNFRKSMFGFVRIGSQSNRGL